MEHDQSSREPSEAVTRHRLSSAHPSLAHEAFTLFRSAYARASDANPLLPPLTPAHEARLRTLVENAFAHGGVAAWRDGSLVGYMVAGPSFETRGLTASLVPEYGHAIAPGEDAALYGTLYAATAERLVRDGVQLHLIGHFADDRGTAAELVDLGFGAIVAERLRDLSDVVPTLRSGTQRGVHQAHSDRILRVARDETWARYSQLVAEHAAYYRQSPIFLVKDETLHAAEEDLEGHRRSGDELFVYVVDGQPLAYLVAGPCRGRTEGRMLVDTNTAQVRSAYAVSSVRRGGIGTALLQHAVRWARETGFDRMFVEHETANPEGGAFWRRYFSPFLVFSMRYVDRNL